MSNQRWLLFALLILSAAIGCDRSPAPKSTAAAPAAATPAAVPTAPPPAPPPATFTGDYGPISKVEKTAADKDDKIGVGRQLWAVRFQNALPRPSDEELKASYLIDATGRKHSPFKMEGKMITHPSAADPKMVTLEYQLQGLVYSLPKAAVPQSFQFKEGPPVTLPQ